MKKRSLSVVLLTLALVIGIGASAVVYAVERSSETWTLISEDYYSILPIGTSGNALWQKTLQESDFQAIQEELVDTTVPPDLAAVDKAASDPDANLPDNMLPDGRMLKENWQELQSELLEEAKKISTLRLFGTMSNVREKPVSVPFDGESCDMKIVTSGRQKYAIPAEDFTNYEVMPMTNETILYNEHGIWLVDPDTESSRELLPDSYNGKSYDELYNQAIESGNQNGLVWSHQVCANQSGSKLAYISDKENLHTYSVFMYDVASGQEKLVQVSPDYNYLMIGWVSEDVVLCYKIRGEGLTVVAIDGDGNEQVVNLATDDLFIIDISGDMIAYRGPGSHDVWVSRYDGTASPELVEHIDLEDGVICVMSGDNEFSPSGEKLAFIYSPNEYSNMRYLWTLDLTTSCLYRDMSLPIKNSNTAGVHDFSWENDSTLAVNVYAQDTDGRETVSTWKYAPGRDNGV